MANVEQKEAWNNESGENWVQLQQHFDRALAPWLEVLAKATHIVDGERVLDVGCGNGATTLDAAGRCAPSGLAVGVDLSEPMLAVARERAAAAGLTNVHFVPSDAQTDELTIDGQPYDVVLSRYGIMFFDDPVAAFANMARATAPGGRLAVLAWTALVDQEWITVAGAAAMEFLPLPDMGDDGGPGMFSLADPARIADVLGAAGWYDVAVERRSAQALFGHTVDEAIEFMLATGPGRAMFADADPEAARKATDAIRTALTDHLTPNGVELAGSTNLVTAHR